MIHFAFAFIFVKKGHFRNFDSFFLLFRPLIFIFFLVTGIPIAIRYVIFAAIILFTRNNRKMKLRFCDSFAAVVCGNRLSTDFNLWFNTGCQWVEHTDKTDIHFKVHAKTILHLIEKPFTMFNSMNTRTDNKILCNNFIRRLVRIFSYFNRSVIQFFLNFFLSQFKMRKLLSHHWNEKRNRARSARIKQRFDPILWDEHNMELSL